LRCGGDRHPTHSTDTETTQATVYGLPPRHGGIAQRAFEPLVKIGGM